MLWRNSWLNGELQLSGQPGAATLKLDSAALVVCVWLTALPYVTSLGFYSDDYAILAGFHFDRLSGNFGIESIVQTYGSRPVLGLYLAALYDLFGFRPLGPHLINTAVLSLAIALFYALLRRLKVDRHDAFAAAAILIILPQLSTVRVWFSTFQIPLAMVLALVSLHAQLNFAERRGALWVVVAAISALISVGAYEIFAPVMAAFPLFLYFRQPARAADRPVSAARRLFPLLAVVGVIAAATLAKSALSERVLSPSPSLYWHGLIRLFSPAYDWRTDGSLNIFAATLVNFWHPLVGFVRGAAFAMSGQAGVMAIAVAGGVAGIAAYLLLATPGRFAAATAPARLLLLGVAIFVLGFATFLLASEIMFAPTGMANRTLVAAAPGVALIWVALLRYAARLLPERLQQKCFAVAVAAIVLIGSLRIAQIESYWAAAPAIQAPVLQKAGVDLRSIPANSTIILDGVCAYHGPAIIFETSWDIAGALSLATGRQLRGDAVSSRMTLTPRGVQATMYGAANPYRYGPDLYVYDPRRRLVVQLNDLAAAQRYFADPARPPMHCAGLVGQGELI